jgi:hypothetical protein
MVYTPGFVKISSGIQKLIVGKYTDSMVISWAYVYYLKNKESRLIKKLSMEQWHEKNRHMIAS